MTSLGLRRKCQSARFTWKLSHGMIDRQSLISSLNFRDPRFPSRSLTSFSLSLSRFNILNASRLATMCPSTDLDYNDIFFASIKTVGSIETKRNVLSQCASTLYNIFLIIILCVNIHHAST